MLSTHRDEKKGGPDDGAKWLAEADRIKKLLLLILVLVVLMSASLNVYLVSENVAIKRSVQQAEEQKVAQLQKDRMVNRLVMDLQLLSRQDSAVRALLTKYGIPASPEAPATQASPQGAQD